MKNINIKDLITLIIALLLIGFSIYFGYRLLKPTQKKSIKTSKETVITINPNIDEDTYNKISSLSDYGIPTIKGLGKTDIFGEIDFSINYPPVVEKPIENKNSTQEPTEEEQTIVK